MNRFSRSKQPRGSSQASADAVFPAATRSTPRPGRRNRWRTLLAPPLLVMAAAIASCTTARTTLAPQLHTSATALGAASGEACSSVVPWAGALQVVPVSAGSRFQRAYAAALRSVPGATALSDVTFQEHWYWAVFGTVYCTVLKGEAIQ